MKKLMALMIVLVVVLVGVGVVAADPGGNNPYRDMITNVDCEGSAHDYPYLYTVGLSPWFDPDSSQVSPGPAFVQVLQGSTWVTLFDLPGEGVPTLFCTWTRGENNYRGDVQFAPPH